MTDTGKALAEHTGYMKLTICCPLPENVKEDQSMKYPRTDAKQKQREILGLSVCGTDCFTCPLHGSVCTGCNEVCGKVFHADGKL